jgi:uncharacterized protein YkwD
MAIAEFLQGLIDEHNKVRDNHGLDSLQKDDSLMSIAQNWANNMASSAGLYHQMLEFGDDWNSMGENIAEGQQTIEEVMETWMHSLGHRRNIIAGGFNCIGVGYALSKDGTPYWCVDFGGK